KRRMLLIGGAALLQLAAGAQAALNADQFIEARDGDGRPVIDSAGETWGAAWGDFDGDGCPDLWLGNHQFTPTGLFRNNCNGTFVNRIDSAVVDAAAHYSDDTHGVSWADFDNDGDQDLLEASGGGAGEAATAPAINETWRNNLFVNSGGLLTEAAQAYGLDNPRARSRTPLWVDFDTDGYLDVVIGALKTLPEQYPTTVFRQLAGTFVEARLDTGFTADTCQMLMTAHLGPAGEPALICSNYQVTHIYDMATLPFTDLRTVIGDGIYNVYLQDLAIGDFDGDLDPDVFGAVAPPDVSAALRTGPANDRIHAFLAPAADEKGFSFTAPGDVEIEFDWFAERSDIFLGAGAVAPPTNSDAGLLGPNRIPHRVRFTLSTANPAYLGLPANRTAGIYIGFSANAWQVRVVNAGGEVNLLARAAAISVPEVIGAVRVDQGNTSAPLLFLNQAGALTQRTTAQTFPNDATAAVRTYARSVVAGDLDNDMDLDAYVGASGRVANVPNLLFDNQGNGTFQLAPNAGGAAGSQLGRTDTVTLVDYDQDGFLDLFVSQGRLPAPFSYAAEQQLFRNQGNANHWIELDLEGVTSTRDGVGAIIYATTPDGRVQLR
ncbi:VCBS repeat-containing protein, partial [uncultured Lamprocystis sp.]|uniref:FG-GAP repeat domain-containing protein n=1 Tax=uncultured Lamprocystis sp. TaxID=543132 RepID=UPI0025D8392D